MSKVQQRVIIVGGGTAGVTIAARLRRARPGVHLVIIDPAQRHFYQPLWTLVGGGLAGFDETDRAMKDVLPSGVEWIQQGVVSIDPERNLVRTEDQKDHRYDALVLVPGIRLAIEEVEGLKEALDRDPRVWTNYSPAYVRKGMSAIEGLSEGDAYFTFPHSPVKCGGGPQKIMWVSERWFEKLGVRDDVNVHFVAPGASIFGVPKYRKPLEKLVESRSVQTTFGHHLVAVDHARSELTLECIETRERTTRPYGLLHVTPPQRPLALLRESGLAAEDGFVDVNPWSLQHVRFPNVFSAGDAASLPTAKTGAAVRKQAPVLVDNLLRVLDGRELRNDYDGYTSCPLVVSHNEVILAEFGYDGAILETFPFDQARPRWSMYFLKRHLLPHIYFKGMLRGRA